MITREFAEVELNLGLYAGGESTGMWCSQNGMRSRHWFK
jgi:hypothetical protein